MGLPQIKDEPSTALAIEQRQELELLEVLRNSLYPGASESSIRMVMGYCKARQLDPMQKPVHIVPMSVKVPNPNGGPDQSVWRDVVMPGIGLYRIQAARSGKYAGISEPEFGDEISMDLGGEMVHFPRWCKVTVHRLLDNGQVVEFTAKEYWLENYATESRYTHRPNNMWSRRPYAQIAKCAEAQALRKGFPEIGSQPTAEEMDGQHGRDYEALDDGDQQRKAPEMPKSVQAVQQVAQPESVEAANTATVIEASTGEIFTNQPMPQHVEPEAAIAQPRPARRVAAARQAAASKPSAPPAVDPELAQQAQAEVQAEAQQARAPAPAPAPTPTPKTQAQQAPSLQGRADDPIAQPGMLQFLRSKAKSKGITEEQLGDEFEIADLNEATVSTVNRMIEWVRQQP